MKYVSVATLAVVSAFSLSALTAAQEYDRSFANEISEEVSEHQQVCIDRVADEWSKPEIADENYTELKLNLALNRNENGREAVVFYGTTFNRFLQLERETTITRRVADKPPYLISFRIAR